MTEKAIRLLHFTDPHLHASADGRMRGIHTYATLCSILEHVERSGLEADCVVATGDLVQDETRQGYERFREAVSQLKVVDQGHAPVLCIPGNHDAPNVMAEVLGDPPFQVGGTRELGPWKIIMLSTFSRGNDFGLLGEGELERLAGELDRAGDHHVLVALHHHPVPCGSLWLDGLGVRDAESFFEITDRCPQVRAIIYGHIHQICETERRGVRLMSTPSTCFQFLPKSNSHRSDERPPAYRWLTLRADGELDSEVVWLDPSS